MIIHWKHGSSMASLDTRPIRVLEASIKVWVLIGFINQILVSHCDTTVTYVSQCDLFRITFLLILLKLDFVVIFLLTTL